MVWTAEQTRAFCDWQFDLQRRHYRTVMPDTWFDLLLHRGERAGRLYLDQRKDRLQIVDIALLPAWRSQGVGTALIEGVIEQASTLGLAVGLSVDTQGRARRLYERLGFVAGAGSGIHVEMLRIS